MMMMYFNNSCLFGHTCRHSLDYTRTQPSVRWLVKEISHQIKWTKQTKEIKNAVENRFCRTVAISLSLTVAVTVAVALSKWSKTKQRPLVEWRYLTGIPLCYTDNSNNKKRTAFFYAKAQKPQFLVNKWTRKNGVKPAIFSSLSIVGVAAGAGFFSARSSNKFYFT